MAWHRQRKRVIVSTWVTLPLSGFFPPWRYVCKPAQWDTASEFIQLSEYNCLEQSRISVWQQANLFTGVLTGVRPLSSVLRGQKVGGGRRERGKRFEFGPMVPQANTPSFPPWKCSCMHRIIPNKARLGGCTKYTCGRNVLAGKCNYMDLTSHVLCSGLIIV